MSAPRRPLWMTGAVLLESPSVAAPAVVLAGAGIGPDLTHAGSPAALLWRRIAHHHAHEVGLERSTLLGPATVPTALPASTVAPCGSPELLGG
ncbi:hypothetical protein ACH4VX_35000 [Streptomyces sp. NPDC020731]|uniref:hypothetical protein n=1 Tax=Streptomyces sp. NPDC020731 TaxID=3365085 RepID=UPI0037A7492B